MKVQLIISCLSISTGSYSSTIESIKQNFETALFALFPVIPLACSLLWLLNWNQHFRKNERCFDTFVNSAFRHSERCRSFGLTRSNEGVQYQAIHSSQVSFSKRLHLESCNYSRVLSDQRSHIEGTIRNSRWHVSSYLIFARHDRVFLWGVNLHTSELALLEHQHLTASESPPPDQYCRRRHELLYNKRGRECGAPSLIFVFYAVSFSILLLRLNQTVLI